MRVGRVTERRGGEGAGEAWKLTRAGAGSGTLGTRHSGKDVDEEID